MEIELNGKRATVNAAPETPLSEFLMELRGRLLKFDQVVSQLVVDGTQLNEQKEKDLGDRPVGEFNLLEAKSVEASKLVQNILSHLVQLIDPLKEKSERAGEAVQQGRRQEALSYVQALSDDLQAFTAGLHYSYTYLGKVKGEPEESINSQLDPLKKLLVRLNQCVKSEADVEFADLLSFEVPEILEKWRPLLERVRELAALKKNEEEKEDTGGN